MRLPRDGLATLTTDTSAIAHNVAPGRDRDRANSWPWSKRMVSDTAPSRSPKRPWQTAPRWLGVTSLTEAVALRNAGIVAPLLSWLNPVTADFTAAITHGIDVGVPDDQHLYAVAAAARATAGRPSACICNSMSAWPVTVAVRRRWGQVFAHARQLETAKNGRPLIQVVGVMGHLGCAEEPHDQCTDTSLATFEQGLREAWQAGLRPRWRHLAATGPR